MMPWPAAAVNNPGANMNNGRFTLDRLERYLEALTPSRDKVLTDMERYAARREFPIIGPLVGRFLYQLTIASRATRILELGSGFGYSAYWFALATGRKGRITLTDLDPANLSRAQSYFMRGKVDARFSYRPGDALTIAGRLKGPYDIILNDIDKEAYPETIDIAARLLRPGGLFITDNILWSGRVFASGATDPATEGIRRFTRSLHRDGRFLSTIIPLRDGVALAVRV
jgi:predicted O-methyltransferase YrrM